MDLIEDTEYLKEYIDDEENSIFISAIEGEGIEEINKKIDKIKKIERHTEEADDDEMRKMGKLVSHLTIFE